MKSISTAIELNALSSKTPGLFSYQKRWDSGNNESLPGDVVAWDLGGGMDHIGLVTNLWSESEQHCLIIHNIGAGTRVEDVLFNWKITGHYRFFR